MCDYRWVTLPVDLPAFVPSTDNVALRLYDLGGEGPPLLLAHATGFCGPMWGPMAETLSEQYRCIAFDFRAHGASTRPVDRRLVWQGMADDLLAVIDTIHDAYGTTGPIPAIGHSMGGATLILAETRRPGSLAKAWAFEPILLGDPHRAPVGDPEPTPTFMGDIARKRRSIFPSRAEAQQHWGSRPPLSLLDPTVLQAYVDHGLVEVEPVDHGLVEVEPGEAESDGPVTLACRPEDEASIFGYHQAGAEAALADFVPPFAAVVGEPSPPVDSLRHVAAAHPAVEVIEMPHLTHLGPFTHPEEVGRAALDWLGAR